MAPNTAPVAASESVGCGAPKISSSVTATTAIASAIEEPRRVAGGAFEVATAMTSVTPAVSSSTLRATLPSGASRLKSATASVISSTPP